MPSTVRVRRHCSRPTASSTYRGRDQIAATLNRLVRFEATQHVIANHAAVVDEDTAIGRTQCTAHHVLRTEAGLVDQVLYINYVESFARDNGQWRFARRELRVRWISVLPVETT
jgi:hypothetical protein